MPWVYRRAVRLIDFSILYDEAELRLAQISCCLQEPKGRVSKIRRILADDRIPQTLDLTKFIALQHQLALRYANAWARVQACEVFKVSPSRTQSPSRVQTQAQIQTRTRIRTEEVT